MTSEVTNLLHQIEYRLSVSPESAYAILALLFIAFLGLLTLDKTQNVYASIAASFIALTFCTMLLLIPITAYFVISAIFALIIAGKFFGAF